MNITEQMAENKNLCHRFHCRSPIGTLLIEDNSEAVTGVRFAENDAADLDCESDLIKETCRQLSEYFNGERKVFDLPICLRGTEFRKKVWTELLKIPYGKTCTYAEIAQRIGNPKACRAVGGANNKNPIMIIVPCHRVIGSNGKLVGYASGFNIKKALLNMEINGNIGLL